MLAIPKAQQFAEKVHAYTFPWEGRLNTRTKDLVDLVLLIERGRLDGTSTGEALRATFTTRGTHRLPERLPPPPGVLVEGFPGHGRGGWPLDPRLPGSLRHPRTVLGRPFARGGLSPGPTFGASAAMSPR